MSSRLAAAQSKRLLPPIATGDALRRTLRSPRRFFRTLKVVSSFAFFWLGAVLLAWTVLPLLALLPGSRVQRVRRCQRALGTAFRLFHWYMRVLGLFERRLIDEAISDLPRPSDGGPIVVVANHTTLVDVTAILSRFPHLCCVAKFQYAHNPLFGRVLRLCGFISAGNSLSSGVQALSDAEACLRDGQDVLIFPEGTRSPPGSILPFKRGAFELACRARVPVVPLFLQCAPSALTKDRPWFYQPDTTAKLIIEPMAPTMPEDAEFVAARLRDLVFARYAQRLSEVRMGDSNNAPSPTPSSHTECALVESKTSSDRPSQHSPCFLFPELLLVPSPFNEVSP
jgi:1-acyl-sn-glycerol-3-phosphate acyltransferase